MEFLEFTLVSGDSYVEVMAQLDIKTGSLIELYCYKDDIPQIYNYESDRYYKISVKDGKNSLFVHIKNKERIFKLMLNNDFIFITRCDSENTDYEEDVRVIEKYLQNNGLSDHLIPYCT